jgi:GT2 family glycosyltransferase
MRVPDLSVVVVHHRGEEHLRESLAAIGASAKGMAAETILVDNTRSPGSLEAVLRAHPSVRRVRAGGNVGFAKGCRLGVEAASAPVVAFVNDDAAVETPALPRLLEALAGAPEDVTAVAGRLVDWTGERNDFSDGFLTFDGHAFQKDPGRAVSRLGAPAPGAVEERLFACGGLMAVRREAFLSTGGFDDDYFAYLEDVDFGWRQWIFGRRILFAPSAVARHRGGATGEALGLFARGFLFEKNAFSTAWKNFDEEHFRALMPGIFAAFVGRIGEMLSTRNPGAAELLRDPYSGEPEADAPGGFWRRAFGISAAAAVPARPVVVDDPLTVAHLRALLWIHAHQDSLADKRRAVQEKRRRPDSEIFSRFPLRIVPTYPGDERFDSAWFQELLGRAPRLVRTSLQEIFG